jgi:hypothetical protein
MRDQGPATIGIDAIQNSVFRVRSPFVREIHPSCKVPQQPARKDGHVEVGCFALGLLHGLRDADVICAFWIGAAARELRAAPDLNQPIGNRFAVAVKQLSLDANCMP